MLEALEAMADDNQTIAPRAMILNRKYRTLVSSWIEPLQEEADVGFDIDYVARYEFNSFFLFLRKTLSGFRFLQFRMINQS